MERAKLQRGLSRLRAIALARQLRRRLLSRANPGQKRLLHQPILMAAFFPLGDVIRLQVLALIAETLDDVGIGEAVEKPVIDLIAEGLREASDFAVAAMRKGG